MTKYKLYHSQVNWYDFTEWKYHFYSFQICIDFTCINHWFGVFVRNYNYMWLYSERTKHIHEHSELLGQFRESDLGCNIFTNMHSSLSFWNCIFNLCIIENGLSIQSRRYEILNVLWRGDGRWWADVGKIGAGCNIVCKYILICFISQWNLNTFVTDVVISELKEKEPLYQSSLTSS